MPKKLDPDDAALWQAFTRDVAPIKREGRTPKPSGAKNVRPVIRREVRDDQPPPPRKLAGAPAAPQSITQIDGARARKLKRGALPVDATLDLHGLTQDKAYRLLTAFLARAQDKGNRVILVVTGKGGDAKADPDNVFRETRTGVLRHAVPEWLAEGDNAARVVAWHPAHPKHGGDGALYVVLKRLR